MECLDTKMINDFIGQIFKQNCGDFLKVIKESTKKQCGHYLYECEFQKYPCKVYATKQHILNGSIINYLFPDKDGFYFGRGIFDSKSNIYNIWSNLKRRIKEDKAFICDEWKCFQNFAIWYKRNSSWNINNYFLEIDKDILFNIKNLKQKIYSPNTCLLIPADLNGFLAGDCLKCGVEKRSGNFRSRIIKNKQFYSLGTYSTFEKAKEVYAKEKYKCWIEEINKFELPNDLKEILLKYDFSWNWLNNEDFLICFSDGSSSKKFNTIGSGICIFDKNKIKIYENNLGFKDSFKTGASEIIGVILILEYLLDNKLNNKQILIYSDSQYVVNSLNDFYRGYLMKHFIDVKNKELWIYCLYLKSKFKKISILWHKGHQTDNSFLTLGNSIADELATSAHRADKGANPDDLFSFNDFISDIDIQNKKEDLFNKIYNYYIINDNL